MKSRNVADTLGIHDPSCRKDDSVVGEVVDTICKEESRKRGVSELDNNSIENPRSKGIEINGEISPKGIQIVNNKYNTYDKYYCDVCKICFNRFTSTDLLQHLHGRKHETELLIAKGEITIIDGKYVNCEICKENIGLGHRDRTALNHFKNMHKGEYMAMLASKNLQPEYMAIIDSYSNRSAIGDISISTNNINKSKGKVMKLEPSNVLMVRGMNSSITEEVVKTVMSWCTTHPIYDVRLIRQKVTNISRGFAFVEMETVEHARDVLETIVKSDPPFQIGGREITIGYAHKHGGHGGKRVGDTNEAILAAKNITNATAVALSTANASVDPASMDSEIPSSYSYDVTSGYYYDPSTSLYYDPHTGYYYNGVTGEWLFWNGTSYQVVDQDGTPVTVTPVTAHVTVPPVLAVTTSVLATTSVLDTSTLDDLVSSTKSEPIVTENQTNLVGDGKDSVGVCVDKPKTARKIAKDMERWAKKMNTATEARKTAVKSAQDELKLLEQKEEELRRQLSVQEVIVTTVFPTQTTASRPMDNIRSIFITENENETSVLQFGSTLLEPQVLERPTKTASVIDIPEDDDFIDESKFIDRNKMACLLCKRQFPNNVVLIKHVQQSQLHRNNLEQYQLSKLSKQKT